MRLQLSRNGAVWRYPHASIGLVMLIGVFFQPWFGYIHHKIFKRRLDAINAGDTRKKLGRTIITQVHLWLGRLLITVGVINGGLGIMVTWDRGGILADNGNLEEGGNHIWCSRRHNLPDLRSVHV